jgi:hypothetical protein
VGHGLPNPTLTAAGMVLRIGFAVEQASKRTCSCSLQALMRHARCLHCPEQTVLRCAVLLCYVTL